MLHNSSERTVITFVGRRVESALAGQLWSGIVHRATPTSPKPWIIYDPPDETGTGGVRRSPDAFVVITAPPNYQLYKSLMKAGGAPLYMAPWSLEELQAVRQLLLVGSKALPAKEVKRRFGQFGGVPRYIFIRKDVYQRCLDELDQQIRDCDPFWVARQLRVSYIGVPSEKHILFHYTVADTEHPHPVKVELASPYVYQRLLSVPGASRKLLRWEVRGCGR